jgi:hypothetical protein
LVVVEFVAIKLLVLVVVAFVVLAFNVTKFPAVPQSVVIVAKVDVSVLINPVVNAAI